jgi:hypothetical protein
MSKLFPYICFRRFFFLAGLCLLCSAKALGQISLGTWAIGGTATYNFDQTENGLIASSLTDNITNLGFLPDTAIQDIETTIWNVVPQAGYFVNDRWLLSGILGIQYQQIEFTELNDQAEIYLFNIGAFLRRYIVLDEEGKGGLTATMNVLFRFGDTDFEIDGIEQDGPAVSTFSPSIDVGFFYFVTSHFAIEANWFVLGYEVIQNNNTSADRLIFNTGIDLNNLNIGARWYLYR